MEAYALLTYNMAYTRPRPDEMHIDATPPALLGRAHIPCLTAKLSAVDPLCAHTGWDLCIYGCYASSYRLHLVSTLGLNLG